MQETFFKKLLYVERAYNYENTYYDEDNIPIKYSDYAQQTLRKLIGFIEQVEFTNKKSSKFICRNWRCKSSELQGLWEREFGKVKSNGAFRAQISATSKSLYLLFGEDFAYDFMDQNVSYINEIIDAYKVGSCTFVNAFPQDISKYLNLGIPSKEYKLEELEDEIRVLRELTNVNIEKKISSLDKDKLAYLKTVMDKPLTLKDGINVAKVNLLRQFKIADSIQGYCKPAVTLKHTMSETQKDIVKDTLLKNIANKRVSAERIIELKELFFMMYTKEGLTTYLSQFSSEEIKQAIEQVNKGL